MHLLGGAACAQIGLFERVFTEDFDAVPLIGSPTYQLPNAWSPDPPGGWQSFQIVEPTGGTPEFAGWTFWRDGLWEQVGGGLRPFFDRGRGVVAVADPDLWNDQLQPGAEPFSYQTLLRTPVIDLSDLHADTRRLTLGFDTSWQGGCCGEGGSSESPGNVAAVVRARFGPDSTPVELLRWESAPYFDREGRPTRDPVDDQGVANRRNPRFQSLVASDRLFIDLTDLVNGPLLAASDGGAAPAAAASAGSIVLEFGVEGAGEDAYWAVDNVEVSALAGDPILGDMYIDGLIDERDIDEFALGLLDELAYEDAWGGVSPGDRGSPDGVFDYDDIPWFLELVAPHVGGAEAALAFALAGVPEPGGATLAAAAALALALGRGRAAR
ncbi:hypothetical protein [Botrimarina sp.]|uniref:hypothetical protein n=1 Tax=Botrimarina sp. TaxID=2795802 RepID=UPI0032EB1B89